VVETTGTDGVVAVAVGTTAAVLVVPVVETAVTAETLIIVGGIKKNDSAFQHSCCVTDVG
jgi:hypothetical protein